METKEKDNQVNDPIVVRTLKHSPDANENIPNTSARTSFHTPSRLDVNTPLVHRDIIQSARSSESEHHFNSQIWRIQEENAEIQKTQVELLRRMTVPVPKPPVFDGNILEYPKWENAFDALIEDQVVRPNCKLQARRIHAWSSAKNDQRTVGIAKRRRLQESKKNPERTLRKPVQNL